MNYNSPKIGYLLKTYPRLSETFILNEILELERQGVSLHIFSLRQPPRDMKFHPAVEKVKAKVTYIPTLLPKFSWGDLWSQLEGNWQLLRDNPQSYINALKLHYSKSESERPGRDKFLQAGYLAWQLKKLGVTHLHAHFANVPTTVAEIVESFGFINYSFTAHAKDIYLSEKKELGRKIEKAKFVLTCTKYNTEYLQKLSISNTPILLSYHGLDLDRFQPNIIGQKDRDFPLLLSVGRLCEKKGFPYLLQACQILKQKGYQFYCKIVGYGPMKEELEKLIETLEIGDIVSLVGQLAQDEVIKLYAKADIFALPCKITDEGDRDGIPNVLIEAMAMEVPVVSTDISGISELIEHKVNGILIPEKDPKALADELEHLLTQPQLIQQLKKSSRNKVLRQFSLDKNIKQIKDLFLGTTSNSNNSKEQSKPESQENLEVLTR